MAVAPTEIRTLARSYTKAAINTLVGIMRQPKAPLQRVWPQPFTSARGAGERVANVGGSRGRSGIGLGCDGGRGGRSIPGGVGGPPPGGGGGKFRGGGG